MSEYFTKMAAKALNAVPVVRPRLASWFGPPGPAPAEVFATGIDEPVGAEQSRLVEPRNLADLEMPSPPASAARVNPADAAATDSPASAAIPTQVDGVEVRMQSPRAAAATTFETQTVDAVASQETAGPSRDRVPSVGSGTAEQDVKPELHRDILSLRPIDRREANAVTRVMAPPPLAAGGPVAVAGARSRSRAAAETDLPREGHLQNSLAVAPVPIKARADSSATGLDGKKVDGDSGIVPGLPLRPARLPIPLLARPARAEDNLPTVHVTIGRIEVRATPAPQRSRSERPQPQPTSGLEQYLKRRGGGGHE